MIGKTFNALSSLVLQSAQNLYYYSVPSAHSQLLIHAIQQNDLATFRHELNNGADYDAKGSSRSLLHEAIACQKIEFVQELIQRGATLNDICEGLSPVGRAIQLGNIAIIQLLLEHGANPNCASIKALPSALQRAVNTKIIPLREAEHIANQVRSTLNFQHLTPIIQPINDLFKLENDALHTHFQQYQKAEKILSEIQFQHNNRSFSARFNITEGDAPIAQLIIRYSSRYDLVTLQAKLNNATPYSPEWHYLESVLRHHQALAKKEEVDHIMAFAKECQNEFLKNHIKIEIKLEPELNSLEGNKVELSYPSIQANPSPKYKRYQSTLANYLPQGRAFLDAIKNQNINEAVRSFNEELIAQTEPALHMACRLKSQEIVSLLLQSNVNVNQLFRNISPIQVAIKNKDEALAVQLVEHGANPNQLIKGRSLLYIAALKNWPQLTRALIRRRADPALSFQGETALDAAFRLGHLDVMNTFRTGERELLNYEHSNYSKRCSGYPRYTAFDWHTAIEANDNEAMYILETLKVDPNQPDNRFGTPLHHAILRGQHTLIARLLAIGANPRLRFQNHNALEYAFNLVKQEFDTSRYAKVVETLILNDIAQHLHINNLPLFNFCVHQKLWDGANHLLATGLSGECANTPLSYPALLTVINHKAFAYVPSLLQNNAQQMTALWCLQHKIRPPINRAIQTQDMDLIIILLRDIGENLPHAIDKPLLHEAIIGNGYQGTSNTVMQFLLERGCDINELYHDKTPLQAAIHHYQEGAFDFLLNHNADLKLQNSHGDTALHIALRKAIFAPHIIDMSYRLINEGADLFIENERGECPFDIIMLNSTLRDQMLATYGEAFINEQVKIRNCLGIVLSSEEIQAQMINDPFFGEVGLNWFKGQIKNGTQIAEGCLARLVAHDDTFGKFINDRLGTPYFDFIQNNMSSLLARFEVLQTPAPEVTRARFN